MNRYERPLWSLGEVRAAYKPQHRCSIDAVIRSARDIDSYVKRMDIYKEEMEYREHFAVILLSRANKVIGHKVLFSGGVAGTIADAKVIFQHALVCNAAGLILVHNHPSGNTNPSQSDRDITRRIVDGGKLLDIAVLDHVIVAHDGFFSFADEGIL